MVDGELQPPQKRGIAENAPTGASQYPVNLCQIFAVVTGKSSKVVVGEIPVIA